MEEQEDVDASTPFWVQSRRNNTHFRRTSSFSGRTTTIATQAFLAGAAAILIIFFIIPPLISSVSQFLRPQVIRKSWDYLNFVLVLFAVICGFLSNNTDIDENSHNNNEEVSENNVSNGVATPRNWADDQTVYRRYGSLRSSSSYPNLGLREFESDERLRFYDDTRVRQCRYDPPPEADVDVVADEVVEPLPPSSPLLYPPSAPPYPFSPPPSPPPAPPPSKRRTKKEKKERGDSVTATPPITPEAVVYQKKGGATKDFLIALRRKKKKERQQSIDGLDFLFGSDPPFDYSPPPPPPPPPPRFFQGFLPSKKGKNNRTNSNPPPPPPNRNFTAKIHKAHTSKTNPAPEANLFSDSESEFSLRPIPPPPPPFRMPAWKFVKRGDYVKMVSSDDDQSVDGKTSGRRFCSSPDVDTKADDFIARFRAGLKLEKMNSVKRRRSNLGPEPES